jgi:hypothetical protein
MRLADGDILGTEIFRRWPPVRSASAIESSCRGGRDLEHVERSLLVQGAGANGLEPDESRDPARLESGPDSLRIEKFPLEKSPASSRAFSPGGAEESPPDAADSFVTVEKPPHFREFGAARLACPLP